MKHKPKGDPTALKVSRQGRGPVQLLGRRWIQIERPSLKLAMSGAVTTVSVVGMVL